jgi:hypothetical protein
MQLPPALGSWLGAGSAGLAVSLAVSRGAGAHSYGRTQSTEILFSGTTVTIGQLRVPIERGPTIGCRYKPCMVCISIICVSIIWYTQHSRYPACIQQPTLQSSARTLPVNSRGLYTGSLTLLLCRWWLAVSPAQCDRARRAGGRAEALVAVSAHYVREMGLVDRTRACCGSSYLNMIFVILWLWSIELSGFANPSGFPDEPIWIS